MKLVLLYYDGFSEFEIVFIGLLFRRHDLVTVAVQHREYRSEENQRFCVDTVISDVDVGSVDLFIIPGGDPFLLSENQELKRFIEQLLAKNKKVAGICGGASILAGLGFLKGKNCTGMTSGVGPSHDSYRLYSDCNVLDDQVVVDGNIITAQGQAYVEFAVELTRQMGLYENEEDYNDVLCWAKNIR
jgi:putative intracellular protease/amidase